MPELTVQALPANPGTVHVRVYTRRGTPLDETFTVSQQEPLDQSWDVGPGLYSVAFQWSAGYQNFHNDTPGNSIQLDGQSLPYQVLGAPGDQNGVYASFTIPVP